MKTIVIAGNKNEYNLWINVTKHNPHEYIYVYKEEQIMGICNMDIIYIGTFYNNLLYNSVRLDMIKRNSCGN